MKNKQQIKQNKNKQNIPMTKMKNQAKMVNRLVKASAGWSLQVGHAPPVQGFKTPPHPMYIQLVHLSTAPLVK